MNITDILFHFASLSLKNASNVLESQSLEAFFDV